MLPPRIQDSVRDRQPPGHILDLCAEEVGTQWGTNHAMKCSLLTCAVREYHDDLVRTLLQQEYPVNYSVGYDNPTPLHVACQQGRMDMCRLLTDHGADPMNQAYMTINGCFVIVTPLDLAIREDNLTLMKYLIQNSSKPVDDPFRGSPVHTAARFSATKCLEYFISMDPSNVNKKDASESTPIFYTLMQGLDAVRRLVAAGANLKKTNIGGQSVLMAAVSKAGMSQDGTPNLLMQELPGIMEFLVKSGAREMINVPDGGGIRLIEMLLNKFTDVAAVSLCMAPRDHQDNHVDAACEILTNTCDLLISEGSEQFYYNKRRKLYISTPVILLKTIKEILSAVVGRYEETSELHTKPLVIILKHSLEIMDLLSARASQTNSTAKLPNATRFFLDMLHALAVMNPDDFTDEYVKDVIWIQDLAPAIAERMAAAGIGLELETPLFHAACQSAAGPDLLPALVNPLSHTEHYEALLTIQRIGLSTEGFLSAPIDNWLMHSLKNPRGLKSSCRVAIYLSLDKTPSTKARHLQLPSQLVEYLTSFRQN